MEAVARIRVGDIEIDGNNVSIGGVSIPEHSPPPAVPQQQQQQALVPFAPPALPAVRADDPLIHFPVSTGGLYFGGIMVLLVAVVCALAQVPGLFLAPIGVGLMVVATMKRRALELAAAGRAREGERELAEHGKAITGQLRGHGSEQTVEWLMERTKLPESTIVRTLASLRARGEITEELDTDTGNWFYTATARALAPPARDLDARLAALQSREARDSRDSGGQKE